jgi:hypothetical protein
MLRKKLMTIGLAALFAAILGGTVWAQSLQRVDDDDYGNGNDYYGQNQGRVDRYLDVDIWSNRDDGDYYIGDNIQLKFRVNRDAFVVIYSLDTRGRVNLLFPASPNENNYVEGGSTYSFPAGSDDYDLVVTGPEGVETVQILASRERIPIPDWYPNSGVIFDWDDRNEFMDWVNDQYFVRYPGQSFAYDREVLYVNEWEDYYFRPVYYPTYPSWTIAGNVYIDYPYGSSVYINGIYWGVTPLYIPRIYVGWHTFTFYDRWGNCWEHDIHVHRYNTVVIDRDLVVMKPGVTSKYKDVRSVGYRDPIANGYPNYKTRVDKLSSQTGVAIGDKSSVNNKNIKYTPTKRYAHGTNKLVKTDRGLATTTKPTDPKSDSYKPSSSYKNSSGKYQNGGRTSSKRSGGSDYYKKGSSSSYQKGSSVTKKSGSTYKKSTSGKSSSNQKVQKKSTGKSSDKSSDSKSSSGSYKKSGSSGSSSKAAPKSKSGSSGSKSSDSKSKGGNKKK